ncbi:MAG: hypothetical protein ACRDWD_09075 [Acidimicrobiia bacterium]
MSSAPREPGSVLTVEFLLYVGALLILLSLARQRAIGSEFGIRRRAGTAGDRDPRGLRVYTPKADAFFEASDQP